MFTIRNPRFNSPDRRYKVIEMDVGLFFELHFNPWVDEGAGPLGVTLLHGVKIEGLPDDVKVEAMAWDEVCGRVRLRLWSATWPKVEEGHLAEDISAKVLISRVDYAAWTEQKKADEDAISKARMEQLTEGRAKTVIVNCKAIKRCLGCGKIVVSVNNRDLCSCCVAAHEADQATKIRIGDDEPLFVDDK